MYERGIDREKDKTRQDKKKKVLNSFINSPLYLSVITDYPFAAISSEVLLFAPLIASMRRHDLIDDELDLLHYFKSFEFSLACPLTSIVRHLHCYFDSMNFGCSISLILT